MVRRGSGRTKVSSPSRVEAGPIVIDSERHEATLRKIPVSLTVAEFRLLRALVENPGRVFTRDQLLSVIAGGESVIIDRNIDVHIRSIRKKLSKDGELITAIRGVGYKFEE